MYLHFLETHRFLANLRFLVHFLRVNSPNEIYALLEARRKELGLSQADVSERAFGRRDTSAIQNLKRGSSPSAEKLEKLCAALDMEFYVGPRRSPLSEQQLALASLAKAAEAMVETIVGSDFEAVPRFDVFLAAGAGAENGDEAQVEHLSFSKAWLRRMGIASDMGALLSVRGDSMYPTLRDGDIVLVDRSRFTITSGRVYAIIDQDGLAKVKRLIVDHELVYLKSDNPAFETELWASYEGATNNEQVIGEVVWSGHTWR